MSLIRADGMTLKDESDDEAFQMLKGDVQRLALNLGRGSVNAAYVLNTNASSNVDDLGGTSTAGGNNTITNNTRTIVGDLGLTGLFGLNGMPVGGNLLATSYGAGSGTHAFNPRSLYCFFRATGGGGQGGNSSPGDNIYSGGGGEGATLFGCIKIEGFTTAAYTTGAGGSGSVINSGAAGGAGGNSSITVNGVGMTAYAGLGGQTGGVYGVGISAHGGLGGGVQYWVDTKFFQWGTIGNRGQSGGYGTIGSGGATNSGTTYGAGSAGGYTGGGSNPGNDGIVTFYELFL